MHKLDSVQEKWTHKITWDVEIKTPTRIPDQMINHHYKIKEILRHYNRLDATVRKHTQEIRKNSMSKESNKFANQLYVTPKEIDIKEKGIQATKAYR